MVYRVASHVIRRLDHLWRKGRILLDGLDCVHIWVPVLLLGLPLDVHLFHVDFLGLRELRRARDIEPAVAGFGHEVRLSAPLKLFYNSWICSCWVFLLRSLNISFSILNSTR